MIITRVWAMPNRWTFTIPPIADLLARYVGDGKGWIDPFAGKHSPAEITNDLNVDMPTEYHLDALDFLRQLNGEHPVGAIFDPPYSITQARDCYGRIGMDRLKIKPTSMKYWAEVKNKLADMVSVDGLVICFGWSSMGLGENRGFRMIEILLVPHGGSKNDTICTVERKVQARIPHLGYSV